MACNDNFIYDETALCSNRGLSMMFRSKTTNGFLIKLLVRQIRRASPKSSMAKRFRNRLALIDFVIIKNALIIQI